MDNFKDFIIEIDQSPYPPYHKGKYLEQYFIDFYFKNLEKFKKTEYNFLPVCWTDIYNYKPELLLKLDQQLSNLDASKKYFTVSQHDDAPYQNLPPNTLKFSAGGNQKNCIPIPLICSGLEYKPKNKKDIFCSFVGSITQNIPNTWAGLSYNIRMNMLEILVNNPDYVLKPKIWSPEIKNERQDMFLDITSRSKFTLCPRGYGATSFRLYEAMQLESIPVYIYHETPHTPFSDEINWEDICILIEYKNISNIDKILKSITDDRYNYMLNKIKEIYPKYFTLDRMCVNIYNYIANIGNNK